ncbi:MAG: 4'-phosphopantetheinyl transferase superfamily protein [Myxococcota bacterium]
MVVESLRGALASARRHDERPGAVDVFRIPLARVAGRHVALLDARERARAERRERAAGGGAAFASRAALRLVVAHWLGAGADAASLALEEDGYGRPCLAGRAACDVDFNLSHSRGLALVAVARGVRIGVDLERVDPRRDVARLAARVLAADEQRALAEQCGAAATRAFHLAWSAKEAFAKASGAGLRVPPRRHAVQWAPDGAGRIALAPASADGVPSVGGGATHTDGTASAASGPNAESGVDVEGAAVRAARDASRAVLRELELPDGFVGAICALGAVERVRAFDAEALVA